jgi:hypothetical protein
MKIHYIESGKGIRKEVSSHIDITDYEGIKINSLVWITELSGDDLVIRPSTFEEKKKAIRLYRNENNIEYKDLFDKLKISHVTFYERLKKDDFKLCDIIKMKDFKII